MATPDPRELQRLIKQLNEVEKRISDISGNKITIAFDGETDPQKIADQFGSVDKAINFVNKSIKRANTELETFTGSLGDTRSIVKDINLELQRISDPVKKARQAFGRIDSLVQQMTYNQADLNTLSVEDIKNQKKKSQLYFNQIKLRKEELKTARSQQQEELSAAQAAFKNDPSERNEKAVIAKRKELNATRELLSIAEDKNLVQDKINDTYNDQIKKIENMNSGLGISGKLVEGLGGALEKLGFKGMAAEVDKAKEKMKQLSVELSEGGEKAVGFSGKVKVLAAGLSSLGSSLAGIFTDPLFYLGVFMKGVKALGKLFTHIDHSVSNVGKTLGLSRDSAQQMTMAMKSAAAASGDTFLNMDRMLNAQLRLSSTLGTNVRLTGEQLGNQARLAEFVGLQEDELANVYTASLLTGQSQEQLYNSVVDTNDSIFASNQLFKEAAGITGQIALNLGNNPAAISKAVAEAKRFGLTLDNARDMAMGTLDFENSIQKELEAQVLTGKAINLNRARELAFAGDFEGAMGEMLKQVGGINEFQNMNVLAQQALAESMGMSVDQLSNALVARERTEKIQARQEELERQGLGTREASLKALRENQTVSERLSNAAAKIGDFFGGIIAPAVEFVADNLETAMALFGGLFGNANKTKDELGKMQEHIATATQKGEELKSKFSGVINFVKSIGAGLKSAFDTVKDSPVLQILGGLVGGVALFKGAKNLFQGKGLFGQKLGASASNPLYVTMAGASFASDIGSSISKTFKGKIFKGLSTVLGGKKTMAGRAMRGMAAKSMAGGLAKTAMRGGSQAATKGVGKVAGKSLAKAAGKSLLKKIPIVGALAGIGFGISRAMKGDFLGAAMEVGSGLASTIPGVGTAASVGLDAALAARDVYQGTSRGVDPQGTQTIDTADFVIKSLPEDTLAFAGGTQFGKETNDLLRQLIAAVNQGGDVIMDGNKVGSTLSLASYKL